MEIEAQTLKAAFQPVALRIVFTEEAELEAFKTFVQNQDKLSLDKALPTQEMTDQVSVILQEIQAGLENPQPMAQVGDIARAAVKTAAATPTKKLTVTTRGGS